MSEAFSEQVYFNDEWQAIYCGKKQVFKPNYNFESEYKNEALAAVKAINMHDELAESAIGIFNDFAENEISNMPPSIVDAWFVGKKLSEAKS